MTFCNCIGGCGCCRCCQRTCPTCGGKGVVPAYVRPWQWPWPTVPYRPIMHMSTTNAAVDAQRARA